MRKELDSVETPRRDVSLWETTHPYGSIYPKGRRRVEDSQTNYGRNKNNNKPDTAQNNSIGFDK